MGATACPFRGATKILGPKGFTKLTRRVPHFASDGHAGVTCPCFVAAHAGDTA